MINIKVEGLNEALASLDPSIVNRAAYLSINRAARSARTEASKAIRAKFNLPAARVNKEVRGIKMASRSDLTAVIRAEGRPIGLTHFGARWVRNVGKQARTTTRSKSTVGKRRSSQTGVFVSIIRGKKTRLPNAFMARGRLGKIEGAGGLQVFQRANLADSRSGLINKASITIAAMFGHEQVQERVTKVVDQVWTAEFNRQLDRLIR